MKLNNIDNKQLLDNFEMLIYKEQQTNNLATKNIKSYYLK